MPKKPAGPCRWPGCPDRATAGGFCERHAKTARKQYDRARGSAAERGYDARWRRARLRFLRQHPLCAECEKQGRVTPATVVDHIKPHKGDPVLFWDESNWQPLCTSCHSAKTAREDGGFGNG